jgi:O-antigen ligase
VSHSTINLLVGIGAGTFGLVLYVGLILVPAWGAYTRLWERVAATFLSLYVLAVFVGVGVGAAAAVIYLWV